MAKRASTKTKQARAKRISSCPYLLRAADIKAREETGAHPWNPKSELQGTRLGTAAGLKRTGVSFVRIPASKESFVYHAHWREEEWIYVLSGRGIAEIDGGEYEVGPGDFMGFPTPGVAHHLRNPGPGDLVYLMGGENLDFEIADFPRHGKRMIKAGGKVEIYELGSARSVADIAAEITQRRAGPDVSTPVRAGGKARERRR
ncbi:MAG: cupin domain-containing protein [Alphaproteobacteria bacterium]